MTNSSGTTHTAEWRIAVALVALSLIPLLGGLARLANLANPSSIGPDNARFVAVPLPVIVHILCSLAFCILGAFQFLSRFRQRNPRWHRNAGKALMVAGLASALTGLWMTQFYIIPDALQGKLLYAVRLLVGVAMTAAIVLAWTTIRQGKIAQHRAWMIRAYALGQGAGTQALILLPPTLLLGEIHGFKRDLLMTAAWVINLMLAEWIIQRAKNDVFGSMKLEVKTTLQ